MKRIICLLLLFTTTALADEKAEVRRLAPKYGVTPENIEVRLSDGTRADMIGQRYVYEVDWIEKHWQAPAQATWYAMQTGLRPAVILLVRNRKRDARHIIRATGVCGRLRIMLYLEDVVKKKD